MPNDPSKAGYSFGLREAVRRVGKALGTWTRWPAVGCVRFGDLERVEPISRLFGLDRGAPSLCIDRYYIERFLSDQAGEIRGRVLEIAEDLYTTRFGNGRVAQSDVLHVNGADSKATIIADLTNADAIPSDSYECIICTQTLQFIYDVRTALNTLHRILQPGGVLLVTVPGISQISRYDMDRWGEYWRFTTRSLERLLCEQWPTDHIEVRSYGNVLASVAYLHGLTARELTVAQLDSHDPDYQLVLTARALKPSGSRERISRR